MEGSVIDVLPVSVVRRVDLHELPAQVVGGWRPYTVQKHTHFRSPLASLLVAGKVHVLHQVLDFRDTSVQHRPSQLDSVVRLSWISWSEQRRPANRKELEELEHKGRQQADEWFVAVFQRFRPQSKDTNACH